MFLIHELGVAHAADAFYDLPQHNVTGIAVLEFLAGNEMQLRLTAERAQWFGGRNLMHSTRALRGLVELVVTTFPPFPSRISS